MAGLPIIGILAAIAAVYAILPDHRRLRVQYSLFGILPLAILSIASCTIVAAYAIRSYLQAPTRTSVGQISTNAGTLVLDATAIELIQLVATLCIVVLFVWVFAADSVPIRNESSLVTLLRTLQNRGEYATLVDIIEDNYTPLISTPPEPTKPQPATLPEAISQTLEIELGLNEPEPTYYIDGSVEYHLDEQQNKPDSGRISSIITSSNNRFDNFVYKFGNWQYHRRQRSEAASYTESLLLDPDFSSQHPLLAPRLGLRIIADDTLSSFPRRAFTHRFLSVLIKSNNSLLFREIRQNRGMTISPPRYKLDSKDSLLQILFNNCELAEDLDVYKPIGDQTRDLLQEQRYKDQDEYNKKRLQNGDIYNEDVLGDPIFAGIQFFDIMVREAFYQRISWHMWLYYYETFTETICANYQLPPNADRTTEWPNDYSRFLYEMIDNMRDWIKMVEEMIGDEDFDIEQSNSSDIKGEDTVYRDFIRVDRIDSNRGANIPKSTVICMISCHQEIMTTDEIPKSFKSYITDIVFRCCLDLYQHDDGTLPQKYGELMIYCIEKEANNQYGGKKYRQETKQVYRNVGMNTGVRHELIVKDMKMTDLVDRIDGILKYYS